MRSIDFCDRAVTLNPERFGCNRNTIAAIDGGFALGAPFVVHVEDDILLGPDALRYFEWASAMYLGDPRIISATTYNRVQAMPGTPEWTQARRRRWYHGWGWGTWRDRWERYRDRLVDPAKTWDVRLNECRDADGLFEVYPILSRSQNIGRVSTLHKHLKPEWFDEHHTVRFWSGQVDPGELDRVVGYAGRPAVFVESRESREQ